MTVANRRLPAGFTSEPAVIDQTLKYRYWLRRDLSLGAGSRTLFVMLNPSTADAAQDDPTIRRCKAFAERGGSVAMGVVNLFAIRATEPAVLWNRNTNDPVGPWNDEAIETALNWSNPDGYGGRVIMACGWQPSAPRWFRSMMLDRMMFVVNAAETRNTQVMALGVTKEGWPRHPLYLSNEARPAFWLPPG